jgi:CBS domain-containing protein
MHGHIQENAMNIGSLCKRPLVTVDAGASLRDAAMAMRTNHVGALLVTAEADGGASAVGIVTDRDLVVEALARGREATDTAVGALASRHLVAVPASHDVVQAVETMRGAGVRRLLVTDAAGHVVGLVATEDLLEALVEPLRALVGSLRGGIEREGAERGAIAPPRPRPVFLPMGTPGMHA